MSANGPFLFYWKYVISTYGLLQGSAQQNWLSLCTAEEKNADDLMGKTLYRHIKICLWRWKWIYIERGKDEASSGKDDRASGDLQW